MNNNQEESEIKDFYHGSSVFVTGATGLMGKVLIEKLLFSCDGIATIIVLVRKKSGQTMQDRLATLIESRAFDRIKETYPNRLSKITAVEGDIVLPGLGLMEQDMYLLNETVSVVFHTAATVKFDDPLRTSITINVQGTKNVVDVARKMQKLKSFVHVSTAYCNCDRQDIDETIYPSKIPPKQALEMLQWMDDGTMASISPHLTKGRPNTYTLTKALTESFLEESAKDLPICIVRPSIVTASLKDPFPGWVDSLNGATAVYLGIMTGALKTFLLEPESIADFIPVDVVINLMIAAAWSTSKATNEKCKGIKVYNSTSGSVNPLTWGNVEKHCVDAAKLYPTIALRRYPAFAATANNIVFAIKLIQQHYVPAFVMDIQRLCQGKKPVMVQFYKRTWKAMDTLSFFTHNTFTFSSKNQAELYHNMGEADRMEFNFNIESLDWREYIKNHILGVKKFILKENENQLEVARANLKRLYKREMAHNTVVSLLLILLLIRERQRVFGVVSSLTTIVKRLLGIATATR